MARMVHCSKLGKELPALEHAPMKGELGERIYNEISKEAWSLWLKQSTMIINEYRINPAEPQGRKVLREQMEKFFFGGGIEAPPDYVPPAEGHDGHGHHHH